MIRTRETLMGRRVWGGQQAASPSIPLRTIAMNNRTNNAGDSNASYRYRYNRYGYYIAAESSNLQFLFLNWTLSSSGTTSGANGLQIIEASLEGPSGAVIPITFGGSRSYTFSSFETKMCDQILPSAFSLSTFPKSDSNPWCIKYIMSNPTNGVGFLVNNNTGGESTSQTGFYDPSVTFPSSTDIAGKYTFTGTAPIGRVPLSTPLMLGTPLVDGFSWGMAGDSIGGGFADGSPLVTGGKSFFNRALYGSGGSDILPGINYSVGGTNSSDFIDDPYIQEIYQYVRFMSENHAANEINGSTLLSTVQANHLALWQNFRDGGVERVAPTEPFTRTTSTDGWSTAANQTVNAGWGVGEVADLYTQWLQTQIGTTIDAVATTASARDAIEFRKWYTTGVSGAITADGLHPKAPPNISVGAVMAPILRSF